MKSLAIPDEILKKIEDGTAEIRWTYGKNIVYQIKKICFYRYGMSIDDENIVFKNMDTGKIYSFVNPSVWDIPPLNWEEGCDYSYKVKRAYREAYDKNRERICQAIEDCLEEEK